MSLLLPLLVYSCRLSNYISFFYRLQKMFEQRINIKLCVKSNETLDMLRATKESLGVRKLMERAKMGKMYN